MLWTPNGPQLFAWETGETFNGLLLMDLDQRDFAVEIGLFLRMELEANAADGNQRRVVKLLVYMADPGTPLGSRRPSVEATVHGSNDVIPRASLTIHNNELFRSWRDSEEQFRDQYAKDDEDL